MRALHPLTALLLTSVIAGSGCTPEPKPAAQAPAPVAAPAAEPPPPPPVSADDLAPTKKVDADGIVLAELVDGRVRMQTTAVWGEALDTTYDSCEYFRAALPVLERQLSPERGKHLAEVCVVAPPPVPETPVKAGRRVKAAPPGSTTPKPKVQAAAPAAQAPAAPATTP